MRALFFPSDLGGGFGHIGRCLALAEELVGRGWEAAFILRGPHAKTISAAGWAVFTPPMTRARTCVREILGATIGRFRTVPAYTFLSGLSFQLLRDGFRTPEMVQKALKWELDVVSRFHPDIVVGDTSLLTSIVGRAAGLPVVQIIQAVFHPTHPDLVWWRTVPPQIQPPEVETVFGPVLKRLGLPPIERAEDLLDADLFLIPGIPSLDPLPATVERTYYVGALVRSVESGAPVPGWLEAMPTGRPVVYVTVGGGASSVRSHTLLSLWQAAFAGADWEIVVSTGGQAVPRRWRRFGNISVLPWVPGTAMAARADAVVFHGGHGTMMETVRHGVPSVIVPFHSEQEANGRRLEASGAGIVLPYSTGPYEPVRFEWPVGGCSMLIGAEPTLIAVQLRPAVARILREEQFRASALRLKQSLAEYAGPSLAADLVESVI